MKQLCIFIVIIFCGKIIFAQPAVDVNQQTRASGKGNTYAVIVGISNYLDSGINLQFANRDAISFSDFLMSASGGSVPKKNIKLLLDSNATSGEVDKAFVWAKDNCQKDDNIFFYFSGHGALENETMYEDGYLICYNTPPVAFINMGFSMDRLNKIANTISVTKNANVIIITDACHSGRMAKSKFTGNFLAGEQLMLAREKEIRIASCKPDELSNEKTDWGGGRGVFSYYLVNGLQGGLADADHDGIVSVGELKTYLENKMADDVVLKDEGDVQTPVINGSSQFQLATVVESESKKIKENVKNDSMGIVMMRSAMLAADEDAEPADYFFSLLKKQNLEGITDSLKLNTLSPDEIAFAIIAKLKVLQPDESKKAKLNELETALKTDKEQLNRFNLDLARSFLDIGQTVIANYIRGDEAELERRRYYNSNNNGYDVYTRMFAVAQKLSAADKYYSTRTAVLLHYFSGLALRIKIPLTENADSLIEQALTEQKKALELEEHAAYIYNELGVLYNYKNELTKAEEYFIKASTLSPQWAIPQSNLSSLYIDKKNYQKALLYADSADVLQKGLQSSCINHGIIHEKTGNLLFAEEDYRNAIDINSRHFSPFEKLGYLYLNTTDYAMADSFFYEADLRKKGYHFEGNGLRRISDKEMLSPTFTYNCSFADTLKFLKDDMLAWFSWGVAQFFELATGMINADGVSPHVNKDIEGAIRNLKKVITLDKKNPLVYHYLARVYYEQQQWEEAELMFRYAMQNYMSRETFNRYLDSVKKSAVYPYEHSCYEDIFESYYYDAAEDLYFLASLYEKWGQPVEAEKYYNQLIETGKPELAVYMKRWKLLEKQGLYQQAENVLKHCEKYFMDTVYNELNDFYRRVIEKEPGKADWYYKLGLLLYDRAGKPSKYNYTDTILLYPKTNREKFTHDLSWEKTTQDESGIPIATISGADREDYLMDIGPGTSAKYNAEDIKEENEFNGYIIVPGTGEQLVLARNVLIPRYDGIFYLKKAAELISEKEALASVNYKIAEIYEWAGSKKMALPYFEKSLALVPDNVNTRLKLINIYTALYKNSKALVQLNYLSDKGLINFDLRLQLARFNMLAGNFVKANTLLNKAYSIHPFVLPEIYNLYGLLNMMADKPKEALAAYKKSVTAQKTDPWFNNYTLARLYAKTGNAKEAWKYLEFAINSGFNYSYVLQNDTYMESLRKTTKWQTVIKTISMKKYKSNKPVN